MIGGSGTELITGAVSGKQYAFLAVNADAVISVLTGVDGQNGVTSLNIGGATLKQANVIRLISGEIISAVTVSSGSVWGIRAGSAQ